MYYIITLGINTWPIGSVCHIIQENTSYHKFKHCFFILIVYSACKFMMNIKLKQSGIVLRSYVKTMHCGIFMDELI